MLARDDAALVAREKPIGGRRDEPARRPRADLPRRRILQPMPTAAASGNTASRRGGRFPDLHEKHNLATSDARHRRRAALRLVRHRSARRARHARRRRLGEAPRRRVLAVRHQLGTRQLSCSLQGSADSAVRSRVGFVPARTRRADGHAALEGGSRKGARLVQHAARRARPERRRAPRELERAHRRLRSGHGRAAVVRRCSASDTGSVGGLSRRPRLLDARVSEQPVPGAPPRRARRRVAQPRRLARAWRRLVRGVARRTTTGCSISPTTSAS